MTKYERQQGRAQTTNARLKLLAQLAGGPLAYVCGAIGIVYDPRSNRVVIATGRF